MWAWFPILLRNWGEGPRENCRWSRSPDPDHAVGKPAVLRHLEILGRRSLADAARRVVDGAMAGAEPAAEGPRLIAERHASEVGADADHDQELGVQLAARVLDEALVVGLRIAQRGDV